MRLLSSPSVFVSGCAGVRRVGADRLDHGQHGREERRAQHQPPGVRGHRPHQGARGEGMLWCRLVRGHTRLRRQGQHRTGKPINFAELHSDSHTHCKAALLIALALVVSVVDSGTHSIKVSSSNLNLQWTFF
jgi:hypothetical protein